MATPIKNPPPIMDGGFFYGTGPQAGPAVLHPLDQAKVSSTLVSFCAELEPEDPPVVVLERMSPLASLTMVVMDPSALKSCVVVVEEEEELLPEAEEPADALEEDAEEEEDVPSRLLAVLLFRLEMEEDMEDASSIKWFKKLRRVSCP